MIELNDWLSIDKTSGEGNSEITLTALPLTTVGRRNTSLNVKTSSKSATVNLRQVFYEEPLNPDKIPNNQIWAKTTDDERIADILPTYFEVNLIEEYLRTDGWTIFTFDGDITVIGERAFNENGYLQKVVLPKSTLVIDRFAFRKCWNLKEIDIPKGVVEIGIEAFAFGSLASINIPDSVTTIGDYAFSENDTTSITIGSGVSSIGMNAFGVGAQTLGINTSYRLTTTSIVVSSKNKIFDSRRNCNCLIETETNTLLQGCVNSYIPETVTSINSCAFTCVSITSIDIPNSVERIGSYAFAKTDLTSVTIGSNVSFIDMAAFDECYNLRQITCYAMRAPQIDSTTFRYVGKNGILLYPSDANGYSNWLSTTSPYLGYHGWVGATIPTTDGGKIICTYDIMETDKDTELCSSGSYKYVKDMTIDGVSVSPTNTFRFDSIGKHTVVFDLYISTILEDMFYSLYELTDVTIESGITSIGDAAFNYCENLKTVILNSELSTIEDNAFRECKALENISLPQSLLRIGTWAFTSCDSLKSIVIPPSVTEIQAYAFGGCVNLETIEFYENGVELIGKVFYKEFEKLTKLRKIKIHPYAGIKPKISNEIYKETFFDIPEGGILEYPQGSDYSDWLSTEPYYLGYYNWTGSPY